MAHLSLPRSAPRAARILLLALFAILLAFALWWLGQGVVFGEFGTIDLLAYWSVPRGALAGHGFYDLDWLQATQRDLGYQHTYWGGHYYPVVRLWNPPPVLVLLLPLAALPFGVAVYAWHFLTITLYGAAALAFNRTLLNPMPDAPALLLAFFGLPALYAMYYGQLGPILVASLVFAWLAQRAEKHILAGLLLVPLLLKPHLLFIALALLMAVALQRRTWSTLTAFAGGVALLTLISFLLDPQWVTGWESQGAPLDWATSSLWDMAQIIWALPSWVQFAGIPLIGGFAVWRFRHVKALTPHLLAEAVLLSILATPYHWRHDLSVLMPVVLWIGSRLWARGLRPLALALVCFGTFPMAEGRNVSVYLAAVVLLVVAWLWGARPIAHT